MYLFFQICRRHFTLQWYYTLLFLLCLLLFQEIPECRPGDILMKTEIELTGRSTTIYFHVKVICNFQKMLKEWRKISWFRYIFSTVLLIEASVIKCLVICRKKISEWVPGKRNVRSASDENLFLLMLQSYVKKLLRL